jgi:uncharacterized membrane protein
MKHMGHFLKQWRTWCTHPRINFYLSVISKALISFAEIVAGTILMIIPFGWVEYTVALFTQQPLVVQHLSPIAHMLTELVQSLSIVNAVLLGLYFLARGSSKFILMIALLYEKIWAFPVSLALLTGFLYFQIEHLISAYSLIIVLITIYDLVVMYYIALEYKKARLLRLH